MQYTYSQIFQMDPCELNLWLVETFPCEIPTCIDSVEAFTKAGNLLGDLTNKYTYLASTLSFLKIETKNEKRKGKGQDADDMMLRRDAFQNMTDIIKQQYNAVSRIITVKQEINNELKMTGGI